MKCDFCGSTRVIQTGEGFRCRNPQCEGAQKMMQPGVQCNECGEKMDYRGLDSYGTPSYKCTGCGVVTKL